MTKQDYSQKPISELRPMLSRVGITGLRRQSLSKDAACSILALSHSSGLQGDELYNAWVVSETANGRKPEVNTAAEDVKAVESGDLAAMIAAAIAPFVTAKGIGEDAVNALIDDRMDAMAEAVGQVVDGKIKEALKVKTIEVKRFDGATKDVGIQHCQFETLLKLAACRVNTMLVGPAGSGKTTTVNNVAKALDLPFRFISVGMQTTKTDLLGFIDANKNYVRTQLRDAYEHGGVFLLDEMDAGNANVITILNAALANGACAFPDKIVEKHPDFICFCASNTYGRGADRLYVGRNQLDAATLDRFAVVDFDYDEALEAAVAGNSEWTAKVQAMRKAAFDLRERVVVSPRASIEGAKLLAAGFKEIEVESMILWKGIAPDIRKKIESAAQVKKAA